MMFRNAVGVLLFVLVTVSSVQASWEIDDSALDLPPPPKSGSAAEKRDFEILLKYQQNRTDEECELADSQSRANMKTFYGARIGILTRAEFEAVEEFGDEVIEFVAKKGSPFKGKWQRLRPYDANEDIHPCIHKPGGQRSYPSSHAAMGVVTGQILAKIYPEKSAELIEQGFKIGENRVLGGVHHPSDIVAGRLLGKQILNELIKNAEFKRQLRALTHGE